MEFALTSTSPRLSTAQLAPLAEALIQYNRDVASAWGLQPWAVGIYETLVGLPADDTIPTTVVASLNDPGAEAYHTTSGNRAIILSLDDDTWEAIPHECAETRIDIDCDQWVTRPDGTQMAKEISDPFQGHDKYVINGQRVACFAFPSFFDPNGKAPFCKCGQATAPFKVDPGGYAVILDAAGNESDVFARLEYGTGGHFAAALKLAKRNSRLLRRLRGRR